MLYCIEFTRELEDKAVLHKEFENTPTRDDIIKYVEEECSCEYEEDYDRLEWYKINLEG